MAKHIWSILCGNVLQSYRGNQISLIDTLEKITVNAEPPKEGGLIQLGIPMTLVTFITRSDWGEAEIGAVRVFLIAPNGDRPQPHEIEFNLDENPRARVIMEMEGMPVGEPGVYWFVVEGRGSDVDVDPWEEWARMPLEIAYKPPEADEPVS